MALYVVTGRGARAKLQLACDNISAAGGWRCYWHFLLPITDNTPYTACIACKRRYCCSAAKHTLPFYLLSSPTTTFVTVSGRAHPCGTGTTGSTFRRDSSSAAVMRSSSWSARWSRCPFAHGTMPRIHSRSFRNWRLYRWLMHDPPNFRNGNSTKGKHLTRAGSCEGHGHTDEHTHCTKRRQRFVAYRSCLVQGA